jgi:hypothetical protein
MHLALGFTQPLIEISTGNIKQNNVSGELIGAGVWG